MYWKANYNRKNNILTVKETKEGENWQYSIYSDSDYNIFAIRADKQEAIDALRQYFDERISILNKEMEELSKILSIIKKIEHEE